MVTLFEMVEIFYTQEKKRSPRLILRLHNLCWKHSIECRKELTLTRALTSRKLFGLYFHACVSHSVFLLRLVSHRSTNAEMFERLFEELTDISRKTWNRRIEDLATNVVLHVRAKNAHHPNTAVMKQEKELSNISKSLPRLGNTVLPRETIHKYAAQWEAHLKAIAGFFLPGESVSGLSLRFQVAGYLLLVAGEVASSHEPSPPPKEAFEVQLLPFSKRHYRP